MYLSNLKEELIQDFEKTFLILDVGAQKTNVIIYKKKVILFSKEANVGGGLITEEIQRRLGVTFDEAEDLKINGDQNNNLPEEVVAIISEMIEKIFEEIMEAINFFLSTISEEKIDQCFVTGGGILIDGFVEKLSSFLTVEVSILDPFELVQYKSNKFTEEDIEEITYRGVQLTGLAMRNL